MLRNIPKYFKGPKYLTLSKMTLKLNLSEIPTGFSQNWLQNGSGGPRVWVYCHAVVLHPLDHPKHLVQLLLQLLFRSKQNIDTNGS